MSKFKSIHTSRTIMYSEFEKVMDYSVVSDNYTSILNENVFGKKSSSGIFQTSTFLKKLYGFDINYPPFLALKYFWNNSDISDKSLLAFIYAINHDDLLAESISILHSTSIGEKVMADYLAENIEKYHPLKYSENSRKSIARNIISSWKQAGFILGKLKNIRTQPEIKYSVACFAFLLSYLKGNRGEFIWNNVGVKSLCLSENQLRDLAIECAKRDVMQYQHAGSVTVISFNKLLNKIGINAIQN